MSEKKSDKAKSSRSLYWIGTHPQVEYNGEVHKNPRQTIHLAGVDFQRTPEEVPFSGANDPAKPRPHDGMLRELTDEQVKEIKRAAKAKVVQREGKRIRIINTDNPRYRKRENEVPLGAFVYLQPADGAQGYPSYEHATPEPLVAS